MVLFSLILFYLNILVCEWNSKTTFQMKATEQFFFCVADCFESAKSVNKGIELLFLQRGAV